MITLTTIKLSKSR
ncbi:Protein of unknown function [Pyronema omphalodes CBS 100304]|uniref:Uncharacterized protein n=1 Tax=Pyronema omphalodes (strain CBS 100304) TaxID=1076935 RepID=U4L1Q7_PYROM|nr:Protein of unknown function [Pyronema omphalodes CBS 100304]